MYKETHLQKYLDAALQIVNVDWVSTGNWLNEILDGKDFFQTNLPRWESLHTLSALSDLYEITGEQRYYLALKNIWYSIAKTDRHNCGSFSSGEGATGDSYSLGCGSEIETCCTVAWMALGVEYYRVSKDAYVIDELELSYFNGMLGALMEDDKYVTYNTPMNGYKSGGTYDGRRVSSQQDISFQYNSGSPDFNCCQANAARGLGELSEWGVVNDSDGLYINYYGPSAAKTYTPTGKEITIKQTTEYPKNGEIKLELNMKESERFKLRLRIPGWSNLSYVSINGGNKTAVATGYYTLDNTWKNGDVIIINLEMSTHYWIGENSQTGFTSVYYGPILLTLDANHAPGKNNLNTQFTAVNFDDMVVSDGSDTDCWLYFDVKATDGSTVRLIDFASAGKYYDSDLPGDYYSWLKVSGGTFRKDYSSEKGNVIWFNSVKRNINNLSSNISVATDAFAGDKTVLYVTVPNGKEIDKIIIKSSSGDVFINNDEGNYSFIMPDSNVTLNVSFKNITADDSETDSVNDFLESDKKGCKSSFEIGILTVLLLFGYVDLKKKKIS